MAPSGQLLNACRRHLNNHPLLRGILTYSVTWPIGSLVQQTFECKEYSLARTMKFCLYGSMYVAPTLYGWMKISTMLWPKPILAHSIIKAAVEQISYAPFAMCSFFYIMTVLEGGSMDDGIKEIKDKLIPTWKIGVFVWPTLQTLNYSLIPERNRVPFIGMCSLCWTVFLAFVKYRGHEKENELLESEE